MSGSKLVEEKVDGVHHHSLLNASFTSMLSQYRKLLFSIYGPKGSSILIKNAVGKETLAISSLDVIKHLSFRHPVVKFINALISAQNASCGLSGLYAGMLTTRLLEQALHCEIETAHLVVADVCELISTHLLTQLSRFPEQVVVDLDIGNIEQVSSFVRTILGSKGNLNLTKCEIDNLSLQIVRAFLKSIPLEGSSNSFGHVSVSQNDWLGSDANVFDGMLYRELDFDKRLLLNISLLPKDINVLLFAVPLLHTDERADTTLILNGSLSEEEAFINYIVTNLSIYFQEKNVHILANQKSIHPVIKFEMERKGYVVLERLGTADTDTLIKLSGCQAITIFSKLSHQLNNALLGKLSSVQQISIKGKDYILMKRNGSCLSSLLLPKVSPTMESSIKEAAESCLAALKMVVVDGKVVAGGGCLEAWMASQVRHLMNTNMEHLTALTGAPSHHVLQIGNAFVRVFTELAIQLGGGSSTTKFEWSVDSIFHHLWHSEPRLLNTTSPFQMTSRETVRNCVCGLLTVGNIKEKYNGEFHELDFKMTDFVYEDSPLVSSCLCETQSLIERTEGDLSEHTSRVFSKSATEEYLDCGIDADSLEEKVAIDEDVDSLEKTLNSFEEEEGDSLEGRLESLEDDVDSLEGILDKALESNQVNGTHSKVVFDSKVPNILYDSYLAKYNALRIALEGFAQLFQVGHCIFDQ